MGSFQHGARERRTHWRTVLVSDDVFRGMKVLVSIIPGLPRMGDILPIFRRNIVNCVPIAQKVQVGLQMAKTWIKDEISWMRKLKIRGQILNEHLVYLKLKRDAETFQMKWFYPLLLLLPLAQATFTDTATAFQQFRTKYNKTYSSTLEVLNRFIVFSGNYKWIQQHQADTYTVSVNEWTDLTWKEFISPRKGKLHSPPSNTIITFTDYRAPLSVDWRKKGKVSPVKDQGDCGSCWSFSATAALEFLLANTTGKLTSLSEQQLMDCSSAEGNAGCDGGTMEGAFEYVQSTALCSETDYPYQAVQSTCHACSGKLKVGGMVHLPEGNETSLMIAVSHQVVSVGIEADQQAFQFYSGGIFDGTCGTNLDHGVSVVGYGPNYWIVRNSWGPNWGEEGYIRLIRGKNQCGIALAASYPTHPKVVINEDWYS